jgi:hypothetical protein
MARTLPPSRRRRPVRTLAWVAGFAAALVAVPCLAAFGATKSFAPGSVPSGGTSVMTISLADPAGPVAQISFSDAFPAGMTAIAGTEKATNCGPAVGVFSPSPSLLTVSNGASGKLPCVIQVSVTAVAAATTTLVNTTSTISYNPGGFVLTIPGVSGALQVVAPGVPPTITSPPPPAGQVGVPYDSVVTVGGTPPIAVAVTGLPPGLAFSPSTLHISGTPTTPGSYFGTIRASNGIPPDAVQPFTFVIAVPPLTIVTPPSALAPPVPAGVTLDVTLKAIGGLPPYAWGLAGGALPPGVTLDPGGRLSGKPSKTGSYTFSAQVTDARGGAATQTYTLEVAKADAAFDVKVTPNPATSGQTLVVAATVAGPLPATGTLEVWVAGTGARCPAPFAFGDPALPVATLRTAPLDASGRAGVAIPDLRIDDYAVCAHYTGDASYREAFAGPIDAYVIKGALLAPAVAIVAPARVPGLGAISAEVSVTSTEAVRRPGGTVRVIANGVPTASFPLADGVAGFVLPAPAAPDTITLVAEYEGDALFAPAASAPVAIGVVAGDTLAIPTLSGAALALLALALAIVAAWRLRRRA